MPNAKCKWQAGEHPRLFFDQGELERIRQRVKHEALRPVLARLVEKAEEWMAETPDLEVGRDHPDTAMACLYAITGEQRYADWALQHHQFKDPNEPRRHRQPDTFLIYDWCYAAMSDDQRRACQQQALRLSTELLREYGDQVTNGVGDNQVLTGSVGVKFNHHPATLAALAVYGDVADPLLDEVVERGVAAWRAYARNGLDAGGFPYEGPHYGSYTMLMWATAADALRRAGVADLWAPTGRPALYARAMLAATKPDSRYYFHIGDCEAQGIPGLYALLAAGFRDPLTQWLAENGRAPEKYECVGPRSLEVCPFTLMFYDPDLAAQSPDEAGIDVSYCSGGKGVMSFRDHWGAGATAACFLAGGRTSSIYGHWHNEAGHFSIARGQDAFAIDTGRYNMDEEQHNIVLIDGLASSESRRDWDHATGTHGHLVKCESGRSLDYACVDSSGQKECRWAYRHLWFVRAPGAPAYVITVDDIYRDKFWREFWWTMNTLPENQIELDDAGARIIGGLGGGAMDCFFALPDTMQPPQARNARPRDHKLEVFADEIGNGSPLYVSEPFREKPGVPGPLCRTAVYGRPRLVAKVGGFSGKRLAVLAPRDAAAPAPAFEVIQGDNSVGFVLEHEQGRDSFLFTFEHGIMRQDPFQGSALWAWTRHDAAGKLQASACYEATELVVGADEIVPPTDDPVTAL